MSRDSELSLRKAALKYHVSVEDLGSFIPQRDKLIGFGMGGSESLVLFLRRKNGEKYVRKIWSDKYSAVAWDPNGEGAHIHPTTKINLQVEYIKNLPGRAVKYFPKVFSISRSEIASEDKRSTYLQVILDQEYISGYPISTFIARHQPKSETVVQLYKEIFRCLRENVHSYRVGKRNCDTLEQSYFSKIEKRLRLAQNTAPLTFSRELLEGEQIILNGQCYDNILHLLNKIRSMPNLKRLEPDYHCLVMGDTNTENILITNLDRLIEADTQSDLSFTYDDIGLKFVDPRAIGFESEGGNTVDDPMYDNKPFHNSVGNYDLIHGEHFDLDVDYSNKFVEINIYEHATHPFKEPYRDLNSKIHEIMNESWHSADKDWYIRFVFLLGTHFSAMPPFHFWKKADGFIEDNYYSQKRAIAIYCEGVKWLNQAYTLLCKDLD